MKKHLFGIFAILFTLPAFGAVSTQEKCETSVNSKYMFNYKSNSRYQEIYNQIKNQIDTEWEKTLDTPLTEDASGDCTIYTGVLAQTYEYECKAGQTPRQCQPKECWYIGKKDEIFIEVQAREQFMQEMVDVECNGATPKSGNTSTTSANTSSAATMTISGRIVDNTGEPLVGASIVPSGVTGVGTISDMDGNFTMTNFPSGHDVVISYLGFKDQTLSPGQNMQVTLQENDFVIQEVDISACKSIPEENIKLLVYDTYTKKCIPTKCTSDRYKLTNQRSLPLLNKAGGQICTGSSEDDGPCANFCTDDTNCTTVIIGDKCEDQVGKSCTATDTNASKAKYVWENNTLKCEIQKCNKGYLPNDAGTACDVSEGPCSDEQIKQIEHATAGELKRGVCNATECENGYEVSDGKCVAISGNCDPMPENATSAHREWDATSNTEICIVDACKDGFSISNDKKSCIEPTLSREDSEKQIAELQANADAMREREQSTANKLIGGASIGAMGIGGMQLASALAEQNADADAERDMAAYLATFKCDYGQGMTISGGETNIQLPGANVLLPIYNEYITLAADLKTRKESLEMPAGIESEVILDAATSGLYDNAATGITDGAYASLSRALSDPTGADAAEWAAQKSDTASQLKTGAITAGVGALVGIAGNVLTNYVGDKPKEMSAEILAKYEPLKKLRDNTAKLPDSESGAKCPSGSTGTYPNCVCTDTKYVHNANTNACEQCAGDMVAVDNICQCPKDTLPAANNTCVQPTTPTVVAKCDTSAGHVTVDPTTGACTCTDGYNLSTDATPKCTCPSDTHELNANGQCVQKQATPVTPLQQIVEIPPVELNTGNLFALNSDKLTTEAQGVITTFVNEVKTVLQTSTEYCINITGHTDKSGSDAINNPLSQRRANAVRDALVSSGLSATNITATGVGSSQCTSTSTYDKSCRKVVVEFSNSKCQV